MSKVKRFGRYEIQRVLGRGGMGTVHLATDPLIGRTVAIKEIRVDSSDDDRERRELEERFRREFRAAGKLSHPNIVTIYDVGQGGDSYFIAMEYVAGMSLADRLKVEPKLPFEILSRLATQIASGLDYAHDNNIVHRDIKPGNVLLTQDHRPKITDFGLVKMLTSELTMTGTVLGTPAFMSPEQVMGSEVDRKSDQFSFAVILYVMLTGGQPFAAEHPSAILYKIVHEPPQRPQELNVQLPPGVDEVILRGLAKKPEDRYQTCSALASDLNEVLRKERRRTPRVQNEAADPSAETTIALDSQSATARADAEESKISGAAEDYTLASGSPTPTPRQIQRPRAGLGKWLAFTAAFFLLMAAAGYLSRRLTQRDATGEGSTSEASVDREAEASSFSQILRVEGEYEGALIRLNNEETALVVPADLLLLGAPGDTMVIELVANGEVVEKRSVVLNSEPPPPWITEKPATIPVTLEITSNPAGAAITLDGRQTELVTPAQESFEPGRRYKLLLTLPGFEAASWSFELDELNDDQRQNGRLHFPLTSSAPPGHLMIKAPYPVQVTIDGRRYGQMDSGRVPVTPGRHTVELVAEEVFLRQTMTVEVKNGEQVPWKAPKAVLVRITANPANCNVSIDGTFVDATPINNRRVAVGSHEFTFHWPALGKTKTVRKTISRARQKIFETPD